MSGGSLDYVYVKVSEAAATGTVSGEKEELVQDLADLLHDIEWSASGDYGPEDYRGELAEFCAKWEGGYKNE